MRTENKNSYTYVYIVAMSQYSYNKGVCGYFLSISRVRSSNAGAAWGQQKNDVLPIIMRSYCPASAKGCGQRHRAV